MLSMPKLEGTVSDRIDSLIHDLESAALGIRSGARRHLLALGGHVVEPLIAIMRSPADIQGTEAARVLSQLDDPRIVETMQEFLTSSNPLIASIALGTLEDSQKV